MIGFIIAMDDELDSSFKKKTNCFIHMSLNQKYYVFQNENNKSFVMTFSGIGKANAAATCIDMIKTFNVKHIINLGAVGTHKININVNDLIMIDNFYYLDVDLTPFGYKLGQMAKCLECYASSRLLNEKIMDIFNKNNINFNFKNIGTIDSFIDRNNYDKFYNSNFDIVDCFDMESTAIAQIAYKNNVGLSSLKIVSDNLNNNELSANQFDNILKNISKTLTNIFLILIEKLSI